MRFVEEHRTALRAGALAAACVLVAACGAGTEPRSASPAPVVVTPDEASAAADATPAVGATPIAADRTAAEAATPSSADASRAGRERTRGRRAADTAADSASDEVEAPVPDAALAAHARSLAALRAQDWVEAELGLEQLVLEYPDYPGPYVNLALVYLHDGRNGDARAMLDRALALAPGHAAANTQLGILLRMEGKFDEAEAAYRRALESEPDHALAHLNLGVLLDVYLRRPAEALDHYDQYQASLGAPDETVGRWIIDLQRRLGGAATTQSIAQEDGP